MRRAAPCAMGSEVGKRRPLTLGAPPSETGAVCCGGTAFSASRSQRAQLSAAVAEIAEPALGSVQIG